MAKATLGYWQRTRRVAIWLLLMWCLLALAVPLAAPPLEAVSVMSIPLGYYAGAQGILIALVIAAFLFAYRQRRIDATLLYVKRRPPGSSSSPPPAREGGLAGMTGALAMASDWLSGAMLITLAGALFELGHDGLSWLIGTVAGVALGGALIAPHLHRGQVSSVVDFVAQRFGRFAGALALLVAAIAIALLLAANTQALLLAQDAALRDLPVIREAAILIAAVVFIAAATRGRRHGITVAQAVVYALILAALTLPVLVSAAGFLPAHFTFGETLKSIGVTEYRLLESELADPVTLKVFTRPFTTATTTSGLLLTLSLALGIAAMPNVLRRPVTARSYEGARLMPAAALFLILAAVVALPPIAANARLAMLNIAGESVTTLPPRVFALGSRGLADVCGRPAATQSAVMVACAALEDPPAKLRLDDMVIPRERALFAAPLLTGLPSFATTLIAVAVALAALLAIAWLGATLGSAPQRSSNTVGASGILGPMLSVLVTAAALLLVVSRTADVTTLLAWALAVSAAGLAPVLLAGIWWLRANAAGAVIGMIAGVGITLYYIVATRYFAPAFYETWSTLSSAGYGAIADYKAARQALTQAASGGDATALRREYVESARAIANWWGLRDVAAGALGAAAALLVLIMVSLITPRPGSGETANLMGRIRGLLPRVS
jgi:cation/acetate symporter